MKIRIKKPVRLVSDKARAICTSIKDKDGQPKVLKFNTDYDVSLDEYNKLLKEFGDKSLILAKEIVPTKK